MADLRLGVKIGVSGGAESVKQIKGLDDQVKRLQDQNNKAAATAKALGSAYNLSGAEVTQLAQELQRLESQTRATAGEAKKLDAVFQGVLQGFGQQLTQVGFEALRNAGQAVTQTFEQAINAVSEFEAARAAASTLTNDVDGLDRKSTRLNSSHVSESRMPSSA